MKVVGFKALKKHKKSKKINIFCIGGVFKNSMIIGSFLLAFLLVSLLNKNFSANLKQCIQNFVSQMGIWF